MAAMPNAVPSSVPSASIGAKIPPGAPEEKHSSVVMTRAIKMNSSSPTEKLPAAAMGIRLKPPPTAVGCIRPSRPQRPPISPPINTHFLILPPWKRWNISCVRSTRALNNGPKQPKIMPSTRYSHRVFTGALLNLPTSIIAPSPLKIRNTMLDMITPVNTALIEIRL